MRDVSHFRIGEVVAKTGLTERMIRHYEKLGLVHPQRSASGQRIYDSEALLALAKVRLLKQVGMPLEVIERWLSNPVNARDLIAAHLDYLRCEADRVAGSILLLKEIDQELAQDGDAGIDHLARIISSLSDTEAEARARAFFEKHFSPKQHDDWRDMLARLHREVDPVDYDQAWRTLISDIKAALPLDPASEEAQAFLSRWEELLAPFRRVASAEQQEQARTMWSNVGEWGEHARQPATPQVIEFIKEAYASRPQG